MKRVLSKENSSNGDSIGDNNTYKLVSGDRGKYIKVLVGYNGIMQTGWLTNKKILQK